MDCTFIERCEIGSGGTRVAVKDAIDVAGLPTTGGCRALSRVAKPADSDSPCLADLRAAVERGEARIVGKANLDELCNGAAGVNQWFGTAANPRDPGLIPGGSSSGSAVAVGADEADVGIGTDTGGSVRIPSACCGVTGLKTTFGRISTERVVPLSQSLDTVGPIARDVAGVAVGMALLEAGFEPAPAPATIIGRVRLPGVDPRIDAAVDDALAETGIEVIDVALPGWEGLEAPTLAIALTEGLRNYAEMLEREPENLGEGTKAGLLKGRELAALEPAARRRQGEWLAELERAFERVELLAVPTLSGFPVAVAEFERIFSLLHTMELNLAGVPALAQPVRTPGAAVPASLQLFGPRCSEELLVATGTVVEAAAGDPIRPGGN